MKGNLCFLFILLCSCQYFCSCVGEDIHTHKLVLQWPISFCNTGEFQCRNNVPDDDFTIHGLRHFNHNGNILINCGGAPLGRDGLSDTTRRKLKSAWPNLKNGGRDIDFWGYQWSKHGSCSGLAEPTLYFERALHLKSTCCSTLFSHLKMIGFTPSASIPHTAGQIIDIISEKVGQVPGIKCNTNTNNAHQLLEITFCFDARRHPMNCSSDETYCPVKNVFFPSSKTLWWTRSNYCDYKPTYWGTL
ncbi:intracellular ribonuclease LX-like [Carica papaya]|uniref:intracellular ribonuclease LX-like n=1 Tax=Carica papaya TaxID=3649 RepID=UPI000B8D0E9B|nr:intracellular ribonuclease LX-like [Carica papaya]